MPMRPRPPPQSYHCIGKPLTRHSTHCNDQNGPVASIIIILFFLIDSGQVFEIILYMTWFYNMTLDVELGKAKALTNFQFIGLSFCFSHSLTIIKLKKIKSKQ